MQKTSIILLIAIISIILIKPKQLFAQYLKKVSAFDNNYNNSSGIIAISDTAIYEYSWYFEEWLQLPSNGLVTNQEGSPILSDVSAFDNNSLNPTGIYVISDTAVFVFNYYSNLWHPLRNHGLIRDEGIVQLSNLSAHKELETENVRVHVISDTAVFRYNWYLQSWYVFPNSGIITDIENKDKHIQSLLNYPNPFSDLTIISFELTKSNAGKIRIALYNQNGSFIKEVYNGFKMQGKHEIELSGKNLVPGTYFYEISGENFSQAKKMLRIN